MLFPPEFAKLDLNARAKAVTRDIKNLIFMLSMLSARLSFPTSSFFDAATN